MSYSLYFCHAGSQLSLIQLVVENLSLRRRYLGKSSAKTESHIRCKRFTLKTTLPNKLITFMQKNNKSTLNR